MIDKFKPVKSLIKTKSYHIDYPVFRLHYQVTVCLILTFCLLLTTKIMFGDPMDCLSRVHGHDKWGDNMCFSQGTFTEYLIHQSELQLEPMASPELEQDIFNGLDLQTIFREPIRVINRVFKTSQKILHPANKYLYPGIPLHVTEPVVHQTVLWHRYYQYMPIILVMSSVFFYFPHYLWKMWENGVISATCKMLYDNRMAPNEFIENNHQVVEYVRNCIKMHPSLVYKYFLCHILLYINLVLQIVSFNALFNNQFVTYGSDVIHYMLDKDIYGLRGTLGEIDSMNNPMDMVFPKATACSLSIQGQAGGAPERREYLCALPLNILNDKFFLVLWFWFLILGVVTVFQVGLHAMYVLFPRFRTYCFKRRYGPHLSDDNKYASSMSELFVLDLIGSNSDKIAFAALLGKLNKDMAASSSSMSEIQSLV